MESPSQPLGADERWMQRALELARQGIGLASPNPTVGCVIVRDGVEIGAGFHEYDKRDHAEVAALRQARSLSRGATAYVTLEPCCTHGRTGPCTDALIEAGIARVVVATADPNPRVAGDGISRLRNAGIEVSCRIGETEARELNDAFAKHILTGVPLVTQKIAMSLDSRIAPADHKAGETAYITGEAARAEVQRMRHASDAVLTGIGTVLADDPLLTDRSGLPRRRRLLRVVLDSNLRLPLQSRLVQSAQQDLVVFTCTEDAEKARALRDHGVDVEVVAAESGRVSLTAVLKRLGELEIISVLTETGSQLNSDLLAAQVTDKIALFTSPIILGENAVPAFKTAGFHVDRLTRTTVRRIEEDILFTGYVRDPWGNPCSPA